MALAHPSQSARWTVEATEEPLRSAEDIAEWNALWLSLPLPLPFQSPHWNLIWWKHLSEHRTALNDHFLLLRVRDGSGTLRAVAPWMRTERPAVGPLRLRIIQSLGSDPNITELRTLVCQPADVLQAMAALEGYFAEVAETWDVLCWTGIPGGTPAEQARARNPQVQWTRDVPAFCLRVPDSFEAFKSSLPRNTKEAIRKCFNAPKRAGIAYEFREAKTEAELSSEIPDFLRLHALRAEAGDGPRHPNVFSTAATQAFLSALLLAMAEPGHSRIFALKHQGKTIASRIAFQMGQTLYMYFSGFEPSHAAYSPTTRLLVESWTAAISAGVRTIHLSTGRDVSKTRWRPEETCYREAIQSSSTTQGEWAARLLTSAALASLRDKLRNGRVASTLSGLVRQR